MPFQANEQTRGRATFTAMHRRQRRGSDGIHEECYESWYVRLAFTGTDDVAGPEKDGQLQI